MTLVNLLAVLKVISVFLILILVSFFIKQSLDNNEKRTLNIAYPKDWDTLVPYLQRTGFSDSIMSNVFDSLVDFGENGILYPEACTHWTINNDFTIFNFFIKEDKFFSNGVKLEAKHFKDSWETSLKNQQLSHNKSTQDLLYNLKGYDSFEKTQDLSGIDIVSRFHLRLHFKKPFRQALEFLSGVRYSAYLIEKNKFIGSGSYVLESPIDSKKLSLKPNKYSLTHNNIHPINIKIIPPKDAVDAFRKNNLDIYVYGEELSNTNCQKQELNCIFGEETAHVELSLNGLQGRVFQKKNNRQAFFAIIYEILQEPNFRKALKEKNIYIDSQYFLPIQAGRLSEQVVGDYYKKYKSLIYEFLKYNHNNPITIIGDRLLELIPRLEKYGVNISKDSGSRTFKEIIDDGYRLNKADVIIGQASVTSGDPDGLYHSMGKNGAILYPMTYRESVGTLLEEGRQLDINNDIDKHYKRVSNAILTDIPSIHIGFRKHITIINSKTISIANRIKKRNIDKFELYQSK